MGTVLKFRQVPPRKPGSTSAVFRPASAARWAAPLPVTAAQNHQIEFVLFIIAVQEIKIMILIHNRR